MSKSLLHVALFLVGLIACSAAIQAVDTMPFWSWARQKVSGLEPVLDDYDTLFVGSSRIQRGVIPEVFDRRMAELGTPTRSFNLGFAGFIQHDFEVLVDWVLERRPARLARVLIELREWDQGMRGNNWMTDHVIQMHTLGHLGQRLRSVWLTRDGMWERFEDAYFVCIHTLANALRVGQGTRIVDDLLVRAQGRVPGGGAAERDEGWENVDSALALPHRRRQHEAWRADPARAANLLREKRDRLRRPPPDGQFNHAALQAQAERLRAVGIEPIFVVMPSYNVGWLGRGGMARAARAVRLLDMDDPDRFPTVFEFDRWFDNDHLRLDGATAFSRRLAECLVE